MIKLNIDAKAGAHPAGGVLHRLPAPEPVQPEFRAAKSNVAATAIRIAVPGPEPIIPDVRERPQQVAQSQGTYQGHGDVTVEVEGGCLSDVQDCGPRVWPLQVHM
jgi:hypothetical protein